MVRKKIRLFLLFQYGSVFGAFYLGAFIFSPISGQIGRKIGPKVLCISGAMIQAICTVIFGFLEDVNDKDEFIGFSIALRYSIIQGNQTGFGQKIQTRKYWWKSVQQNSVQFDEFFSARIDRASTNLVYFSPSVTICRFF